MSWDRYWCHESSYKRYGQRTNRYVHGLLARGVNLHSQIFHNRRTFTANLSLFRNYHRLQSWHQISTIAPILVVWRTTHRQDHDETSDLELLSAGLRSPVLPYGKQDPVHEELIKKMKTQVCCGIGELTHTMPDFIHRLLLLPRQTPIRIHSVFLQEIPTVSKTT